MKTLTQFQAQAQDVTIKVAGSDRVIISASELRQFIAKVYGQKFTTRGAVKKLTGLTYLMGVNSSSKVEKGLKKEMNTGILYLQPYKTAFGNSCPMGAICVSSCLNTSGRVKMDVNEFNILRSRYLKTVLFYVNRPLFNSWLHAEIDAASKRFGDTLVVRLNGTSDISPKLFEAVDKFPDVKFYDYTKILNRAALIRENYHLTFSYSGYNDRECNEAINQGLNVSIVVDGPQPKTFNGVPVFSMDETDLRPFDEQRGQYGYLKLKETLNKDYNNKFVIAANDPRLGY